MQYLYLILPAALWPCGKSASDRNEYQEYFLGFKCSRCVGLTNLPPFMGRLSRNLGALASWNPEGLSRPVQRLPYLYLFLLTYLLTPWCRVLLEKLTGLQLVKKFPAFHGTRKFVTALTSVRHLSLSWASPIQSIYPHPTSWRSILMRSL